MNPGLKFARSAATAGCAVVAAVIARTTPAIPTVAAVRTRFIVGLELSTRVLIVTGP